MRLMFVFVFLRRMSPPQSARPQGQHAVRVVCACLCFVCASHVVLIDTRAYKDGTGSGVGRFTLDCPAAFLRGGGQGGARGGSLV